MDNKAYEWDLEALLQNHTIEELFEQWKSCINQLINDYDGIFDNLSSFKKWVFLNEEFNILDNRLNNYVSNKLNENIIDQTWISWTQKIEYVMNDLNVKTSDYHNRLYAHEKEVKEYLKDSQLNEFQLAFDNIFKYKPHILSNDQEQLLSELAIADGGVNVMFSSITDSEIKYNDVVDQKNKKHKIEKFSDAILLLKNKDRVLRKNTWISFNKAFYDFKTTLTYALYYNYLYLNKHAQVRHFKDYISSTCFDDEITIDLLSIIYKNVKQYKSTYQDYINHRNKNLKQILQISKVEPWDTNVDLIKKSIKFEIEDAKNIVLEALKPMGNEYLNIVKKAFKERWISWLPKKNKYSGAYSIGGTKGLNKFYILMNYDKTLNSIFTLIHELGHSINSYYYSKAQKVYAGITIFCAEIASITNEMLLNYYLLNKYKNDDEFSLLILDELISGFFATTSRQIIFSNFEWNINELINEQKPINYEIVASTYLNLIDEYVGIKNKAKNLKIPYLYNLATPLRISHFYAGNFYVYKYAIGQVVAIIIAKKLINNEDNFINKYIEFLSCGTSKSPIESIKILGIDLYDDKTWIQANEIMQEFIDIYKKIKINFKQKS